MQKSFIDRIFPNPKKALLPRYDTSTTYHDDPQPTSREPDFARSVSNRSDSRSSARSYKADSNPPSQPPISASIIHHKDPFIAVDRAAQNLQRTIQSCLDFQNESLSGRHQEGSESLPQRSLTPTPSVTTSSLRDDAIPGAVPIRQPARKKTTLRGARRGIGKAMHDFANLKEEELRITQDERMHRKTALEKVTYFEAKRDSLQHEISNLQTRAAGDESNVLREEAQEVQKEIHELEGRLMELKAKHRHLTNRAEQMENSAASDLSSYQGALALVDKEVRSFLQYPPVKQGLGPQSHRPQGQDMYSLRPERRSLGLAKEQWTIESKTLEQHEIDTRREKDALVEGAKLWQETVQKVDQFEESIRTRVKNTGVPVSASTSDLVSSLDDAIQFLEERLSRAETNDWKLLICAIGAELESFRQARILLAPDDPVSTKSHFHDSVHGNGNSTSYTDRRQNGEEDEDADVPHADLLGEDASQPDTAHTEQQDMHGLPLTASSSISNESLEATLKDIPHETTRQQASFTTTTTNSGRLPERREIRYSESEEDDDPGPDFLLSR